MSVPNEKKQKVLDALKNRQQADERRQQYEQEF